MKNPKILWISSHFESLRSEGLKSGLDRLSEKPRKLELSLAKKQPKGLDP